MENILGLYTKGLSIILDPGVILLIFCGVFGGITIGSLPGLTATMGVAVLVPLTYGLSPIAGILTLIGIWIGGCYGGSISACLINIPGTPAAIMTSLDAYPLMKKGQAGKAIGLSTVSSFLGGMGSVVALSLLSPLAADIALTFTSAEFFTLGLFGLSIMAYIGRGSFSKSLISGLLGLLVATVGSDPITGFPRFTFNRAELFTGVEFVTAIIGLFGVSEILIQLETTEGFKTIPQAIKDKIFPGLAVLKKLAFIILRSSFIGVIIGAIPGAGATIASIVSYGQQKRLSKHPEEFGEGSYEGVASAESANNACTGGAMLTMLSLGIPGDGVTAILIGALMIHGLRPGPMLFAEHFDLVSAIFIGMFIANIFMLAIGLAGARLFARLISTPKIYLNSAILAFTVIGSFAIRNSLFDVMLMIIFASTGYLLAKASIPRAPLVLGLILGPIIESNLRRGIVLAKGSTYGFFLNVMSRPASALIMVFTVLVLLLPFITSLIKVKRAQSKNG